MFTALPSDGTPAWPTAHLRPRPPAGRSCVLLLTGALYPVHAGHVASLVAARRAVEAHGWCVLGGFLSPSHDLYCGPKHGNGNGNVHGNVNGGGNGRGNGSGDSSGDGNGNMSYRALVGAASRVRMARLATRDVGWIAVGTWEARPSYIGVKSIR